VNQGRPAKTDSSKRGWAGDGAQRESASIIGRSNKPDSGRG